MSLPAEGGGRKRRERERERERERMRDQRRTEKTDDETHNTVQEKRKKEFRRERERRERERAERSVTKELREGGIGRRDETDAAVTDVRFATEFQSVNRLRDRRRRRSVDSGVE
jgi:hypothetical protein